MALGHQFLFARAHRYRHLASKARRLASVVSGDKVAPGLLELADKLERDAGRDEELAHTLEIEAAADHAALAVASSTAGMPR